MHGTRVFLPNKVRFLTKMSQELKADIIAFAYRGFSHSSQAADLSEVAFHHDVDAISSFYNSVIEQEVGPATIETLLWGKSFGCSTALVA